MNVPKIKSLLLQKSRLRRSDWVAGGEELAQLLDAAGVMNEYSHKASEVKLPRNVRLELGVARFISVTDQQADAATILNCLSACPTWFLALRMESLELP